MEISQEIAFKIDNATFKDKDEQYGDTARVLFEEDILILSKKILREVIWPIIQDPYYETEYDHRMETYCFFCGSYQHRNIRSHEDNCIYERIRKELEMPG